MKKFHFPLERVRAWRETQTRLEEAALARLRAELQALDLRRAALSRSVQDAQANLLAAPSTSGAELGAMEHYRNSATAQSGFLLQTRRTLEQKVAAQTALVTERRRAAKLLDQLRARRLAAWEAAANREIDQLADESFLARLTRDAVE